MKLFLCLVVLFALNGCATHKKNEAVTEVKSSEVKNDLAFDGHCGMGLCLKKFVKGDARYAVEYKGKIYHFSSQKAKDDFVKDIDKNIQVANDHWRNFGPDKVK